jgi:hypothetical protein
MMPPPTDAAVSADEDDDTSKIKRLVSGIAQLKCAVENGVSVVDFMHLIDLGADHSGKTALMCAAQQYRNCN